MKYGVGGVASASGNGWRRRISVWRQHSGGIGCIAAAMANASMA